MTSERTDPEEIAIPLYEEKASIFKRRVVTGQVQVSTVTHEHEQVIDEQLAQERVEIERIPINKQVDTVPAIREEGETTIIPVVEEVLVVERRLVLKEEVRIRRIRSNENHRERVILRRQEAIVTRSPVESSAAQVSEAEGSMNTDKKT
jgi:stress response protein YsnF